MLYLDNAATSFTKPKQVYEAMDRFMRTIGASAGRSAYKSAVAADRIVFDTRESLAKLFTIKDAARIVFTQNATDALNTALLGSIRPGQRVLVSSFEHNSVMRPLRFLRQERDISVEMVLPGTDGMFDLDKWEAALQTHADFVVVNHGSNITGAVAPLIALGALCKKYGAGFIVDAAQTAGAVPVNVDIMNINLLAFSGHKSLFGPQGTGGLYIREGLDTAPLRFGGTGSNSESDEQPLVFPDRFESGTQNGPGIAGLGAGVSFVLETGIDKIAAHGEQLVKELVSELNRFSRIRIYGRPHSSPSLPTVSICIDGLDNGIVARRLNDEFDIAVRSGLHCAPDAHKTQGTFPSGTLRLSFAYFNTEQDINKLILALKKIC
ncbi:MAG: aminotransferase class V-fold PLP-dependent enzyme [Chitinispirillaceae bacterium]|jgi:cysteine desulfurase family protein|nr:aminotransferase class V-fold PLP-dependent enzyme [Chitinispirillaceae bacterium]